LNLRPAPLRTARRILRDSGCRVGRVVRRFARSVRRNRVIAQSERDGAVLPSRSRIDLLVSRGRRR
jgi:beta-lactam-binding protein with PASTA domain